MFVACCHDRLVRRAERAAAPEDELRERPELVLHHPGGRRAHRLEDREPGQPRRFAHERRSPTCSSRSGAGRGTGSASRNLERRKLRSERRRRRRASRGRCRRERVDQGLRPDVELPVPCAPAALRRCKRCEDDRRKPARDAPAERGGELLDRAIPRRRRVSARAASASSAQRRRTAAALERLAAMREVDDEFGHRACRSRDRRSAPRSPRGSTCSLDCRKVDVDGGAPRTRISAGPSGSFPAGAHQAVVDGACASGAAERIASQSRSRRPRSSSGGGTCAGVSTSEI